MGAFRLGELALLAVLGSRKGSMHRACHRAHPWFFRNVFLEQS